MRFTRPVLALALLAACGGGKSKTGLGDAGSSGDLATGPTIDLSQPPVPDLAIALGGNIAPLIVDEGVGIGVLDVAYVSVTICAPGTTTCQTIDHVAIDTGSVGLRIVSSVIDANVLSALPTMKGLTGDPISECYVYADGYTYGSVRQADFTLAGEQVPGMAFHVLGDLASTPSDCSSAGKSESTVDTFGYNGIIGIAPFTADCGSACALAESGNPIYYDCSLGGTCTQATVATTSQVQNPITLFGEDSNGYSISFPVVDDTTGAKDLAGTLTFGIGTRSNNALGSEQVYFANSSSGLATVSATVQSQTFSQTIFDSGTSTLAVSLGIADCTDAQGYLCPASTQTFTATITDAKGTTGTTTFKIANADTLVGNSPNATAFDDIGADGVDGLLILGLPFFYGRTIFLGIDGATTPAGTGPYYAF